MVHIEEILNYALPDVFNHNLETVPRLYLSIRPGSRYFASLELLKNTKKKSKGIYGKATNDEVKFQLTVDNLYDPGIAEEAWVDLENGVRYASGPRDINVKVQNYGNTVTDFQVEAKVRNALPDLVAIEDFTFGNSENQIWEDDGNENGSRIEFRFRSPENNIDVIIEGESNVVESLRQELGLQGRVGFIQPLSARLVDDSELESHAAMGDGENLSNVLTEEEKLPGPPPDPSSIPAVVRRIGDLDIKSKISELDGPSRTEPQIEYIREFLESIDEPEPLSNNLSGDPMAESWLQILLWYE